jgi:hypothetical protein
MASLIQPAPSAPYRLAGMVGMLTPILPVVVVVVLVALLPRLRRVSLEALPIGPVSFGPIRFFFATPRPRAALFLAGPALLPSRSSKCSSPRAERRAAKSGARTM